MRQETQGVTETLIKNATEEFLEYGFTWGRPSGRTDDAAPVPSCA